MPLDVHSPTFFSSTNQSFTVAFYVRETFPRSASLEGKTVGGGRVLTPNPLLPSHSNRLINLSVPVCAQIKSCSPLKSMT